MLIKKKNLKYLVLALALAGYGASSAYALNAVSTLATIQGSAPALKSKVTGGKDNAVSIRTDAGKTSLTVGDKIYLDYVLTDADGDLEGAKSGTSKNLEFWYKSNGGTFVQIPDAAIARGTPPTTANTVHTVTLTLTEDLINVKQIAAVLRPETSYGDPKAGQWLNIGDIFSSADASTPTDKKPGETGGPEIGGGGGPGNVDGPGTVSPDKPIQPSNKTKMGIFLTTDTKRENDYSKNAALIPKVGQTFEAVIWIDSNDDGKITDAEKIVTSNFTITWELAGGNAAAGGAILSTAPVSIGTGSSISIGINSAYKTITPALEAGAQGFKLQATPN